MFNRFILDITGLAFLLSNQFSFSPSFDAVLQIPLQEPVMRRELGSNMYSPVAYFLGRFTSHLLQILVIPCTMVPIMFWVIGIDDSWENFGWVFLIATLSSFVSCAQGFFFGLAISNQEQCQMANMAACALFASCNGCFVNQTDANFFVRAIIAISPARLTCEAFFYSVTLQIFPIKYGDVRFDRETLINNRGFNYGREMCIYGLVAWFMFWVLITLVVA